MYSRIENFGYMEKKTNKQGVVVVVGIYHCMIGYIL